MKPSTKIGHALKGLRLEQGLTQEEMAEVCNIEREDYICLERKGRNMNLYKAMDIASKANLSLDKLIGISEYACRLPEDYVSLSFEALLLRIRQDKGWSKGKMARECKISDKTYRAIENKTSIPTLDTAAKIVLRFDISLDELRKGAAYATV